MGLSETLSTPSENLKTAIEESLYPIDCILKQSSTPVHAQFLDLSILLLQVEEIGLSDLIHSKDQNNAWIECEPID